MSSTRAGLGATSNEPHRRSSSGNEPACLVDGARNDGAAGDDARRLRPGDDSDTGQDMKAQHLVVSALLGAVAVVGCAAPPKQVAPPTILDSGEEDIAPEEDKELEPAVKMPDEMTADEQQQSCCTQCVKGLAADRTGQPPEQIPCADFTSVLDEFCLGYFRDKPMQAAECQAVAPEAPAAPAPEDGTADGGAADGPPAE